MSIAVEFKSMIIQNGSMMTCDVIRINVQLNITNKLYIELQLSVKNCFIRGSVVRYVQLPVDEVDIHLLTEAARREAMNAQAR